MEIDDPTIVALRKKVTAAVEEFDTAIAFHEAWKPAAHDRALHLRLGPSYATNTFIVVRQALRREMLLAMMRLWDDDERAVGMKAIATTLTDSCVIDALVAECEAHWHELDLHSLNDIPESERFESIEAFRRNESEFGRSQGEALRQKASEAIAIINSYAKRGSRKATLGKLRRLRNEHLAHRQVTPTPREIAGADASYDEIEAVYQDMARLIHHLRLAVASMDYDQEATARLHRRNAVLFWSPVRGERTKGHPDYRAPRRRRGSAP